ncbi:MAG: ExbD/TolR family protein, partial [Gammaproteobacteria bacterium]
NEESFRVEVIVRDDGIEISNGTAVIAAIPKKDEEFDLQTLSDFMVELKQQYPNHDSASVLMEAYIPYDYLIRVMDVVRSVEIGAETEGEFELVALFSEISVGDAP